MYIDKVYLEASYFFLTTIGKSGCHFLGIAVQRSLSRETVCQLHKSITLWNQWAHSNANRALDPLPIAYHF
jgi:hypothetical protein